MKSSKDSIDFFAADMSRDTPTHDLHGKTINEALDELAHFVSREISIGSDAVRIIHGRGTGHLRQAIHGWLATEKSRGIIKDFRDSDAPGQAGGVTIVLLEG